MANTNNFYGPIKTLYDKFTIVLCSRDHKQIGTVQNVDFSSINLKAEMLNGNEVSFDVYYELNGKIEPLWNDLVDFKLIYIPELNDYLEITITDHDTVERKKSVVGVNAGIAELSQTQIYGLEINTPIDIEIQNNERRIKGLGEYQGTIFYDPEDPSRSLLHRALYKIPQYSIGHVPESVAALERRPEFSINDKSVWDFLSKDVAEEFEVMFLIDNVHKIINVYDLLVVCNNCSHRQDPNYEHGYYDLTEYAQDSDLKITTDSDNAWLCGNDGVIAFKRMVCSECGSTDLNFFGEDTRVVINKENLTDDIELTIDTDSIKNTFKLETGDDYMTSTVVGLNPNGSEYINLFNELDYVDMPDSLVSKIESYNDLYDSYKEEYAQLMEDYYDALYKQNKYAHSLMPSFEQDPITAQDQASKITPDKLSPLGLASVSNGTVVKTVNNALEQLVKTVVKTGYVKAQVDMTEQPASFEYQGIDSEGHNYGQWTGRFLITNYSNNEDTAYSRTINVLVTDDYETYLNDKIAKNIVKYNDKEGNIFQVLNLSSPQFEYAITRYSVERLGSFHSALSGCIDILTQEGHSNVVDEFYDSVYEPYYAKLKATEDEIGRRQSGIEPDGSPSQRTDGYGEPYAIANVDYWTNIIGKITKDDETVIILDGSLEARKREIQDILNFKNYLGEELYNIYCAYRREQTYSNSNYISTGVDDKAALFAKAREYLEAANRELLKATTPQYSVKCNLYNLIPTTGYEVYKDKFVLGNWIRVIADDQLFRLRLVSYSIDFSDFNKINVEFSNVTKIGNIMTDVESILNSAKSISGSYGYTTNQASAGEKANTTIGKFVETGLLSALTNVKNNVDEEITFGENGIYAKSYDPDTETYSPEQLRITHNILVFTKNNWETASAALGKHDYTYYDPNDDAYKIASDYGLTAEFVQAGHISGSSIIGGDIYSSNYSAIGNTGSHINLNNGTFSFGGNKLTYDGNLLSLNGGTISASSITNGNNFVVTPEGKVTARDITLENGVTSGGTITGAAITGGSISVVGSSGTAFSVNESGLMTCTGAQINGEINNGNGTFRVTNSGTLTATDGTIGGWNIGQTSLSGTSGNVTLYNTGSMVCSINNNVKWGIYNDGTATFSNITATGGNFENVTIAGYATIEAMNLMNLNIQGQLSAVTANIGTLTADKANIEDLTTGTLTVHESINAQNLDVNGTITVNQIKDSQGNLPSGTLKWQTISVAKALNPTDRPYLWQESSTKNIAISASQPSGAGNWNQVGHIVTDVPTKRIFVLGIDNVSQ